MTPSEARAFTLKTAPAKVAQVHRLVTSRQLAIKVSRGGQSVEILKNVDGAWLIVNDTGVHQLIEWGLARSVIGKKRGQVADLESSYRLLQKV